MIFSDMAIPRPFLITNTRGPVVVSIPGNSPNSGCPAAGEFTFLKLLM